MKTLKNTGVTLMLAVITATAALAQNPSQTLAKAEQMTQTEITNTPQSQAVVQPKTFGISLYRVQQSLTMHLNMEKKAGERATVRLLDQNGQVLHEEWVGRLTKKYACEFDFSQIKDGRYTIEVANGAEISRKNIELSSAKIVQTPDRNLVAFK